jgi:hypothetical protein
MRLVSIFTSRTATELEAIVTVLEARAVPCFVRDNAITSRTNPWQLQARSVITVLVPAEHVSVAVELIGALQRPHRPPAPPVVRLGRAIRAAFQLRPRRAVSPCRPP